jgi:hypothetical protein
MVGRDYIILVVTALAPVLRGQPGRNAGANDDTTRHLSGRSVRVLASGLAFVFSASRMPTRERGGEMVRGEFVGVEAKKLAKSWGEKKVKILVDDSSTARA